MPNPHKYDFRLIVRDGGSDRPYLTRDEPRGGEVIVDAMGDELDKEEAQDIAFELAHRWNRHDKLLAACKAALPGLARMGSDWGDEMHALFSAAIAKAERRTDASPH